MPDPTVVVLAMHGEPPGDFPRDQLARFFELQAHLMNAPPGQREALRAEYRELERRLRQWPRTAHNDPFFTGAQALGAQLAIACGLPVLVAFNEFCDPTIDEGIDRAVAMGARHVVVLTPMLTPGGLHSDREIPRIVERAARRLPDTQLTYAWPYSLPAVAAFLAEHLRRFTTWRPAGCGPSA